MKKSRWVPAIAILSLSVAPPVALAAEGAEGQQLQGSVPDKEEQVRRVHNELQQLKQVNVQLYQRIQYLEGVLQQLVPAPQPAPGAAQQEQVARRPSASTQQLEDGEVKKAPEKSRTMEDVALEEHTLFDQTFSVELGVEYSHFDRSQLVLNGFLALDAIFLGNISIDEVEADIWTTSLAARWGLTDRLQLNARVPWVYRETSFSSGGQQLSSVLVSERKVDDSGIGDVSLGVSYQLLGETSRWPDVVWSFSATAPTGRDPYGIKFIEDEDFSDPEANTNLQIPQALPTGTGLWALTTGFSFLRTTDPAVFFASISYTHYLEENFDDLISDPTVPAVGGDVQLGDRYRFSAGLAFALNERSSMSFSFAQEFFDAAEVTRDGERTREIIGSETSTGNFNVGATYALTERMSVVGDLGIGLTQDTSDYTFNLRFPYRF